ncbi:2-dehydro-3-deoxygalactonokinase [Vibrio algivorus]|uniref:2-dehydro-3-deoxygalactonokinase n=1 Tax=Vibrio algivorus TaxID=1667024 RepID=A0ABQ6EQA4_9VIBR|nr:2-dehydro-3-deoxygalactonokinase [Vibrio algivorus]GLT15303.1 2-dehydro-3-deoxygalactonokinase [Vibrio algivorus]
MKDVNWLIIDWGTTNFRAFAMNEEGKLVDKIEKKLGLLQVEKGNFAQELEQVLLQWIGQYQQLPIFMAGMVGSAQGWIEVPYVQAPASLDDLVEGSKSFRLPWGAMATVIPGVNIVSDLDNYDVMRGEEVQIFGLDILLNDTESFAIFPGTHSKHVKIKQGCIQEFKTYMTGELFSLLSQHSILGRGLPTQIESEAAFKRGVLESQNGNLTNKLFNARTHRLFNNIEENEVFDYLSGILIGQEFNNISNSSVYLVGSDKLCECYYQACKILSINSEMINGDETFLAGMLNIKQEVENGKE